MSMSKAEGPHKAGLRSVGTRHQEYALEGDASGFDITRDEYEAALAASKQPEWDGEGLPPVGCECEAFDGVSWFPVVIVGRYDGFAFAWNYDQRKTLTVNEVHSVNFRPIITEAERKREEAILAMRESLGHAAGLIEVGNIYRAIAAGKIPGIKLDD
ncbi:hypothetical protein GH714_044097 [Hevea brasiliensis]|uniref:Uncharacterized protein n=1 Tax=Hevea brasiliensis TaxID=3981 RepID=A0A6A6K0Z2_HEVBR|nr:hypothetical protein GH714_044097 [Hevea brasiliensis]